LDSPPPALFHYAKYGGWEDQTKKLYEGWCRKQPKTKRILSSKEFVAGFEPPDYLVDGLLQEGFLYSLKTAITLRLAASTGATGAGISVEDNAVVENKSTTFKFLPDGRLGVKEKGQT
jgi:hypothetical protein